jgi:hypothetical protein
MSTSDPCQGTGSGLNAEIIIVSGLPRSGTSLMMQMLDAGGLEVVTDHIRSADPDNPRGYYELERVKKIKEDKSWLPATRGKVFKMISQLLYDLPASECYRIIFMERDFAEMLASQEKMLQRLGRQGAPPEQIRRSYTLHLERLRDWVGLQANMQTLYVSYNELVEQPHEQALRINDFLGGTLNVPAMSRAVDPSLYRQRR